LMEAVLQEVFEREEPKIDQPLASWRQTKKAATYWFIYHFKQQPLRWSKL
jgi:hypothetical protein